MGKFYETTSVLNYSWDQVVRVFWKRYPNPFSRHVISEDTLHREMRENGLYSRRLLTKTSRLPKWGERFVKSNQIPVIEESIIDLDNKEITTYTRNIAYVRIMSVIEKVTYTPDSDNPDRTVAHRSAWIESKALKGLRKAIETFAINGCKKHSNQTIQGFNYVLRRFYPKESPDEDVSKTDAHPNYFGGRKRSLFNRNPKQEPLS